MIGEILANNQGMLKLKRKRPRKFLLDEQDLISHKQLCEDFYREYHEELESLIHTIAVGSLHLLFEETHTIQNFADNVEVVLDGIVSPNPGPEIFRYLDTEKHRKFAENLRKLFNIPSLKNSEGSRGPVLRYLAIRGMRNGQHQAD